MQRRHVLSLVVLPVLALAIAGCGTANQQGSAPAAAAPAATPPAATAPAATAPSATAPAQEAAPPPAAAGDTATDSQNGMVVKVTFANATAPQPGGDLVFNLAVDNHSVDLTNLDLTDQATLIPDPGNPVTSGFQWQVQGSGHHVTGVLRLPNRDSQGEPIVTAQTRSITLELRGIGGATRLFRFANQGWQGVP